MKPSAHKESITHHPMSQSIMQDFKQQAPDSSEREHRFKFHLISAQKAFDEAKQDGSPLSYARCLSHAKVAVSVARKADRPDLERDAQLAIVDFLEMAGRKKEAMEARIIAAAIEDNLEIEYASPSVTGESDARLASVGGVPIDEVIRLLENDGHEQGASYLGQKQNSAATDPHRSDACEPRDVSEPRTPDCLPKAVLGRQIRDLHGRLATVLTEAPRLRHKAKFSK